ncbi:MAG TPA: chromosome segregation protein ScpA [Algoriphagus sp.]|uniref:segregation and condensation protein A n=1 Tax=unclassified Algoriphagus TaxID=2641541 RepID=UPI000C640132|nr:MULTISPECIES: segregation/condensation protein A [unclassified Algoriphagus]MAL14822.1 chromosome segregation protein ScpA [Algoriphagus sp.]MAN89107.1 chromosome segregation protein ScpA [Algoriphagus sp.]QYH40763.1 segregation/condensation protein A [Algoriphagus sp. NBT04N3]HAH37879.1 chromosome segregation protein ScpA [Algoriphagus sp.]HAS57147.1 chromosome segregation protein ScpA [Algoriphagus sp.]
MSFEIKLPLFEGPFDLMLFFIERDELDIYDIPISKITNDFLDYIHHLEQMEIEVASEFILFAATLMKIKSRMLLPRPELNEDGEEIDPREELIRNLLEYKKYKSVVEELASLEEERLSKQKRGNIASELKALNKVDDVDAEMQDLDLYKLLKVFQKCMAKMAARVEDTKHTVIQYPYTIEQQKDFILEKISFKKQVPFTEFISYKPEKIFVIYTFLAILELLQLSLVTIVIGEGFNNFWVEKTEPVATA